MEQELVSSIWRMHGALALGGYESGILKLSGGRISFTIDEGEQFNVPVAEVKKVKWPFYQFGLSFTAIVNEKKYRFIFSDPFPSQRVIFDIDKYINIVKSLDEISTGRNAAKKWKAVFTNQ